MKALHFRLQRVLEWRTTQLDLEEAHFRRQTAGVRAENELRSGAVVDGVDLRAVAAP